jgi:hypothetical protein
MTARERGERGQRLRPACNHAGPAEIFLASPAFLRYNAVPERGIFRPLRSQITVVQIKEGIIT